MSSVVSNPYGMEPISFWVLLLMIIIVADGLVIPRGMVMNMWNGEILVFLNNEIQKDISISRSIVEVNKSYKFSH